MIKTLKDFAKLTDEEVNILKKTGALELDSANRMIENVVGITELPIGVATNFLINDKDYLIPMVIEETFRSCRCILCCKVGKT